MGKTHVALRLTRELRLRGYRVATFKPVETGVSSAVESDVQRLGASGVYSLKLPAAPAEAAEAESRRIDLARIVTAFAALDGDVVVVEGAGGLLVPLTDHYTMADLAARLKLPVLLVARARLGTINHTLLTVREIARRDLPFLGTLLNTHEGDSLKHDRWIQQFGGRLLGRYPDAVDWDGLVRALTTRGAEE